MSKSTVFVGIIAVAALGLGGGGLGYSLFKSFENQKVSQVTEQVEFSLDEVAGYKPDATTGDVVVELSHELRGGNTKLIWETGKVQAGKRHDYDGTWTSLGGAIVFDPEAEKLKALEVVILIESFNSYGSAEPAKGGLINTVLGKDEKGERVKTPWFNYDDHPNAVFTATEFVPRTDEMTTGYPSAQEGWTHLVKGKFELNGVPSDLALPALVAFRSNAVEISLVFEIDRQAFNVVSPTDIPLTTVDDLVKITASVQAEVDGGMVIDSVADQLRLQGQDISALQEEIGRLQTSIALMTETLANLERQVAAGVGPATPEVDVASLPTRFSDQVPRYNHETQTTLDPVSFDMVLVEGDSASGIAPFYMATHEVTWDMFNGWAYSMDIDVNTSATLQAKDLRPSPLYEDCVQVKFGKGDRPALSMSRTTAEAFAKWLTETTGRNYRIPTDAEWQHALQAGGGIPQDRSALLAQAWLDDNAERFGGGSSDAFDPFATDEPEESGEEVGMSALVGTGQPNALGIYDLLGNAAEWVVGTGAERIVRGGHFQLPADQLSADWSSIENQDIWNATYPQKPNSRFWYRDHYYQGIRLVCDPVNIPE
ncbi:MAG: SUMF1/EgtB/PvdO family nonheme iron enzyme [Planctomycetota bacterium]